MPNTQGVLPEQFYALQKNWPQLQSPWNQMWPPKTLRRAAFSYDCIESTVLEPEHHLKASCVIHALQDNLLGLPYQLVIDGKLHHKNGRQLQVEVFRCNNDWTARGSNTATFLGQCACSLPLSPTSILKLTSCPACGRPRDAAHHPKHKHPNCAVHALTA